VPKSTVVAHGGGGGGGPCTIPYCCLQSWPPPPPLWIPARQHGNANHAHACTAPPTHARTRTDHPSQIVDQTMASKVGWGLVGEKHPSTYLASSTRAVAGAGAASSQRQQQQQQQQKQHALPPLIGVLRDVPASDVSAALYLRRSARG
jgi:hypothetical protein